MADVNAQEVIRPIDDLLMEVYKLEVLINDDYQALQQELDDSSDTADHTNCRHMMMLDKIEDLKKLIQTISDNC